MNGTPSWVMNKVERMIVGAVLAGSRFSSRTRFPSYTAALELVVPKSRPTRIGSLLYRSQVAGHRLKVIGYRVQVADCSLSPCLVSPISCLVSPISYLLSPVSLSPISCLRVTEHDKRAA